MDTDNCPYLYSSPTATAFVELILLTLSEYTPRIQSRFQCRPLVTAGKVSAKLTDQKRKFFTQNLGPIFHGTVPAATFKSIQPCGHLPSTEQHKWRPHMINGKSPVWHPLAEEF